jgi:hypothetical protein
MPHPPPPRRVRLVISPREQLAQPAAQRLLEPLDLNRPSRDGRARRRVPVDFGVKIVNQRRKMRLGNLPQRAHAPRVRRGPADVFLQRAITVQGKPGEIHLAGDLEKTVVLDAVRQQLPRGSPKVQRSPESKAVPILHGLPCRFLLHSGSGWPLVSGKYKSTIGPSAKIRHIATAAARNGSSAAPNTLIRSHASANGPTAATNRPTL